MIGKHRNVGPPLLVVVAAGALMLGSDLRGASVPDGPAVIGGLFAHLLSSSADLGPAGTGHAQLTVALPDATRPEALIGWASGQDLSVRWRPGDDWAIVEGTAADVASAFDVTVHNYRGRKGQVFYASPQQPSVPAPLRGEVAELGRILGYSPHHLARPSILAQDVPMRGLTPDALSTTYNANRLAAAGFTGKGITIVIFAFDGYDQADLDLFATTFGLPKFTPIVVGGQPGEPQGETTMDLEVVHAIAPDAQEGRRQRPSDR